MEDVVTKPGLIKLTDYRSGSPVYLDRTHIVSMQSLPAQVYNNTNDIVELGRRTRINTQTNMLLVRETPDQVFKIK